MKARAFILAIIIGLFCTAVQAQENVDQQQQRETSSANETISRSQLYKSEEFQAQADKIRQELQFTELRETRRDILQRLPKQKIILDNLQAERTALRTEEAELLSKTRSTSDVQRRFNNYRDYVAQTEKRLSDLKARNYPTEEEQADAKISIEKNQFELQRLKRDLRKLEQEIGDQEAEKALADARLKEINERKPKLEQELRQGLLGQSKLLEEQFLVEDRINVLLIPQTAQNSFKLWITSAFATLVGLVIVGFFVVAWKDEQVRRSIFSSQSGIQFITLFSLVIAIILFGITDILGGKELSALLGGLSGYILGRVGQDQPPRSLDGNKKASATPEVSAATDETNAHTGP